MARGIVLGHVDAVVDGADDDGLIGIALDEVDEDFVVDARPEVRAPSLACPRLRDAQQSVVGSVGLALAIPPELHVDTAVLVHVGVFAGIHDDLAGVHSVYRPACRS